MSANYHSYKEFTAADKAEMERQEEALRRFYARELKPMTVKMWVVVTVCSFALLGGVWLVLQFFGALGKWMEQL